ncbi:MAG: DUF1311 domain-containing protein [Acidobacteria bacterium]|nr:DUF1311 domain-containing protein [Acidobacteriota bacterium]
MKRLFAATLLCTALLGASASAQKTAPQVSCRDPQSQYEMNVCADRAYKAADAVLNGVYNQLAAKLEEKERAKLKATEVSWLKYRDDNCDYESSLYEGGSMRPLIYSSCMERMTKARTAELREQIKEQEQ